MRTSYLIGAPVGLITILFVFFIPGMLTGEGLATMALVGVYGKAILGLIVSFLIALGIGGHYASIDFQKQKSLVKTSFKYSLMVNSIVWSVFIALTIIDNYGSDLMIYLIPPIIAFVVCTIITTFTLGLLICYLIREKIDNVRESIRHSH